MRVCHIARDVRASGGGEVVKQVASRMALEGLEVILITDTPSLELPRDIKVLETPFGGQLLDWKPKSRLGWLIRHSMQIAVFTITSSFMALPLRLRGFLIFNHNCEGLVGQVLVMHNIFSAEFAARPLSKGQRVKALSNPVRFMRIAKELLLSRPAFGKLLVAVSEGARLDVERLAGHAERVRVIENGVDLQRFAHSIELETPTFVSDWKLLSGIDNAIVFIGHEWKRKGLDELLVALSELPPTYGLIVVGGTSQNRELYDRKIGELSIKDRVLFAGEWPDVRPFLAAGDVFCLPSHSETMPLVALEALAAGLPIVLTPECPASQLIMEGVNGSLTKCVPHEISAAIRRSIEIASKQTHSDEIRSTVSQYGWDKVAVGYIDLTAEISQPGRFFDRLRADSHLDSRNRR